MFVIFNLIQPMVTGLIPRMDGLGFPITSGDGGRFIMVVGDMIKDMVGIGCPVMNGDLPG